MNTEQDFQVMTPQEVLTRLEEVTEQIVSEVSELDNGELNFNSDVDEWSVKQIVAHLLDAENIFHERIKKILAEEEPFLPTQEREPEDQDWETELTAFKAAREENLRMFRELEPDQWSKAGIHQERARITLRDIGELLITHNQEHLEQIRHVSWLAK